VKRTLYLLAAFGLGAILAYGAARLYPPVRLDSQEWGVIVTTFGEGARLYGLFGSKEECLEGRTAFVEEYVVGIGTFVIKKGSRSVLAKGPNGTQVRVTFSCLPISDIRGLSLVTGGSGS
jgi:hypothetical protein